MGIKAPDGPLTIASGRAIGSSKEISVMQIPFGASSDRVLAELGDTACLLPLRAARTELTGINRSLMRNAYWKERPKEAIALPDTGFCGVKWRAIAAAQIGLSGNTPQTLRAAVAKARVSEAVVSVASICHAVHEAIGVTEEYDLQLYTRRLHEWRSQYGSESYWNNIIGEAMLAEKSAPLQFIQQIMAG